jgi:hypothetical protein
LLKITVPPPEPPRRPLQFEDETDATWKQPGETLKGINALGSESGFPEARHRLPPSENSDDDSPPAKKSKNAKPVKKSEIVRKDKKSKPVIVEEEEEEEAESDWQTGNVSRPIKALGSESGFPPLKIPIPNSRGKHVVEEEEEEEEGSANAEEEEDAPVEEEEAPEEEEDDEAWKEAGGDLKGIVALGAESGFPPLPAPMQPLRKPSNKQQAAGPSPKGSHKVTSDELSDE